MPKFNEKPFSIVAAYWHGPKNSKKTLDQKLVDMRNCSSSCGGVFWGKTAKEAVAKFRESRADIITSRAIPITMENAWSLLGEGLNSWHLEHALGDHPNKARIQAKFLEILAIQDKMKRLFMEPAQ